MQTGNKWSEAADLVCSYSLGKTVKSKNRFSVNSWFGFDGMDDDVITSIHVQKLLNEMS